MIGAGAGRTVPAQTEDWTAPAEVRYDDNVCLRYQAKLDGPFLVVRATVEAGWHTFAMDNKARAEEKLAGRQSLGIDRPTEITLTGGLRVMGPWYQSPPADFSKPELRWYSWGFERQALFAARVRRSPAATRIAIRGQACTESICKNIDVAISLAPVRRGADGPSPELNLKNLVQVREN
jgi:hypothetical protein